jgi:hypothetical protein
LLTAGRLLTRSGSDAAASQLRLAMTGERGHVRATWRRVSDWLTARPGTTSGWSHKAVRAQSMRGRMALEGLYISASAP